MRVLVMLLALAVVASCDAVAPRSAQEDTSAQRDAAAAYGNTLSLRGVPEGPEDWSFAAFSDQGSWLGFAVPPSERPDLAGGFVGPLQMVNGRWLSRQLAAVALFETAAGRGLELLIESSTAYPGSLRSRATAGSLTVTQDLWFDSDRRALFRTVMLNEGDEPLQLNLEWTGTLFGAQGQFEVNETGVHEESVVITTESGMQLLLTADLATDAAKVTPEGYRLAASGPVRLESGERASATLAIDWTHEPESSPEAGVIDAEESWTRLRERWNDYLDAVDTGGSPTDLRQILTVKATQTLVNNWRGPAGRLRHSGLFPSSNVWYFNGFWAWDSWKQAVGLVRFDPALAQEQVRAMFDHQDASGMVADVVYLDPAEDNWRDTKPPLAGWAVETLYEATGDLDFVRELYPKLVDYHAFWYADRDHDRDGLCEYGSTDGTLIAARWESGMDNAVRFDHTELLQNGPSAWSMNQESVDLNSYLYRDKLALATLSAALGREEEAGRWSREAETLRAAIRETMFDATTGWFYDTAIDSGAIVPVQGPEGWIPLWTGVATPEQAEAVRETMLDPEKFLTFVPFPTVARDNVEFSDGYWRGLVWLDQAYFAIEGLRRYGYTEDATALTNQLLANLEGATTPEIPLFENYHPLTGEGENVKHFSWTAAHLLLLSLDHSPAEPSPSEPTP